MALDLKNRISPGVDLEGRKILIQSSDYPHDLYASGALVQALAREKEVSSVTLAALPEYHDFGQVFAGPEVPCITIPESRKRIEEFNCVVTVSLDTKSARYHWGTALERIRRRTGYEGPLSVPGVTPSPEAIDLVEDFLHEDPHFGKTVGPLVVLHGWMHFLDNWGRRHWLDLADTLANAGFYVVFARTGVMDHGYKRERVRIFDGDAHALAALVSMAGFVVAPASPVFYLAQSLRVPTVGLWGHREPPAGLEEEFPAHSTALGRSHCSPCNLTSPAMGCPWVFQGKTPLCLQGLTVEKVVEWMGVEEQVAPVRHFPPYRVEKTPDIADWSPHRGGHATPVHIEQGKVNILIIQKQFETAYFGGAYYMTQVMQALLKEEGVRVTLYTDEMPISGKDHELLQHPRLQIVVDPDLSGYKDFPAAGHDVIWTMPFEPTHIGVYLKNRWGIPLIVSVFESANWLEEVRDERLASKVSIHERTAWDEFRYSLVQADHVVPLCEFIRGKTLEWDKRIAPERVTPLPPTANFALAEKDPVPLERRDNTVVAISRYTPYKRFDLLANALRAFPEKERPHLIVIGMGMDVASKSGAFSGLQHDALSGITDGKKYEILKRARVLVHTSDFEGFGLPPLEAMACGTPVICSDIPVLESVYGEGAKFFRRGDFRSLVEVLATLLYHDGQWREMSKRGLEQAARYRPEAMRDTALRVINLALNKEE